jgi:hypothetical protein
VGLCAVEVEDSTPHPSGAHAREPAIVQDRVRGGENSDQCHEISRRAILRVLLARYDQSVEGPRWNLCPAAPIASDPSIEAALKPVKLFKDIGERGGNVDSGFAVQRLRFDQPAPTAVLLRERRRFRVVCAWLCGPFRPVANTSRNRQPLQADVVRDHIRFRQHQIGPVALTARRFLGGIGDVLAVKDLGVKTAESLPRSTRRVSSMTQPLAGA